MAWVDDFTTDHFASADYTTPYGPPTSVAPHRLTETGTIMLWADQRPAQAQVAPFNVELDVLAGPEPYLIAVGCITSDYANGFYAGWSAPGGGYTVVAADGADPGDAVNVSGAATWPAGDFTIRVSLDAGGHLTLDIDTQVFTATLAPALMTAFAARSLAAVGYLYAVSPTTAPLTITASEWRYGGGGPPPPPALARIAAGDHTHGVVTRPRRLLL